jgi:hypothetical protein
MNEILLYGGIVLAGVAVVAGVVVTIILRNSKRRLNAKFDEEYGKLK